MVIGFAYWRRYRLSLGFDRARTRPTQAAHLSQKLPGSIGVPGPRAVAALDFIVPFCCLGGLRNVYRPLIYDVRTLQLRDECAHYGQAKRCNQPILDRAEAALCAPKASQSGKHGNPLAAGWARRGLMDLEG